MSDPVMVLKMLTEARNICLANSSIYGQVLPGLLPVIGPGAHIDLRRWGADFLAETFASPVWAAEEKQKSSIIVLETLRNYINRKAEVGEEEDAAVVKSAVQCAASVYPFIFRHVLSNPSENADLWTKMAGIKSIILRSMEGWPPGVRICCIKFISRVVQVQTPGMISDPRRPEQNEISLALVPRDHPVIPPNQLEAEASGLLDRLLGVLQDNSDDALVVTATLNSLSTLVQRRPSVATKILMTVINFNPLRSASAHMSGKDKLALKSMTRTTMSFLLHVLKRNPQHALAQRLQQRTEQLRHHLTEVFSEAGPGKRPAPDEPTDGLDPNKRQRIEQQTANGTTPQQQPAQLHRPQQPQQWPPPLPPGPVTYAELYRLTPDQAAAGFHVQAIPYNVLQGILVPLFKAIDANRLLESINIVRRRYMELQQREKQPDALAAAQAVTGQPFPGQQQMPPFGPNGGPNGAAAMYGQMEMQGQAAQVMNRLDQLAPEEIAMQQAAQMEAAQAVPEAPATVEAGLPLNERERQQFGNIALGRMFATLSELDQEAKVKPAKKDGEKGFNRLAAGGGGYEREGWITLITRLATRSTFSLAEDDAQGEDGVKQENADMTVAKKAQRWDLGDGIRHALWNYVLEDFRKRIDVAIAWLNEEWYADRLLHQHTHQTGTTKPSMAAGELPKYSHWTLFCLEGLIQYLDVKDGKFLIRFLSEIPEIDARVLEKVVKIADDPERITVATQALMYLIMFRPPVRDIVIDAVERLWRENADAKAGAAKILVKWRPGVLEEAKAEQGGEGTEVKAEG